MGNTLLAHVLYSCNQVDLDIDNFFSPLGDAHQIQNLLINKTNLSCWHLIEYPIPGAECLIEFTATKWMQILQYKMAYSKWRRCYPQEDNYSNFFITKVNEVEESRKLWQEFYQNFKDPSWGECLTFADIVNLPVVVQKEILDVYKEPNKNFSVLNLLTISYYDLLVDYHRLRFSGSVEYTLKEYLSADFTIVKRTIQDTLSWNWNDYRSQQFHQQVLKVNCKYLDWLAKIINVFNQCIRIKETEVDLELWEKAIVLSKVCQHFNKHPNQLDWNNESCFLDKNNVSLIKNLKEVNHGRKTI